MMKKWFIPMGLMAGLMVAMAGCGTASTSETSETASTASELSSTNSPDQKALIEAGTLDSEKLYKNTTLKFSIQLPKDWEYLSTEKKEEMNEAMIADGGEQAKIFLDRVTNLVSGSDPNSVDTTLSVTNTVTIQTEEISKIQDTSITDAKILMERYQSEQQEVPENQEREISEVEHQTIDGQDWYILTIVDTVQISETETKSVTGKLAATKINDDKFLEISFTCVNEAGLESANASLESIQHE